MNKFMIKTAVVASAAVLGSVSLAGCGGLKELDGTATLVTVNGTEVPAGVVSFAIRYEQSQQEYYSEYMSQMFGTEYTTPGWDEDASEGDGTAGEKLREDALADIEEMVLIRERAEEYDLEITEDEQSAIDETAKAFVEANDGDMLQKIGVTEDSVREYLELYTLHEKAQDPMVADEEIEVTDEEAAQTTVEYAFLATEEMEDEDKQQAQELMQSYLDQLMASEDPASADMTALAEEISTEENTIDASSLTYSSTPPEEEGDTIDTEVREAAADLTDGQVYDGLVETETGYYILRMQYVLDTEETESQRESLLVSKQQERFEEILDEWREAADISVDSSVWNKIKVTDKVSFTMLIPEEEEETEDELELTGDEVDLTEDELDLTGEELDLTGEDLDLAEEVAGAEDTSEEEQDASEETEAVEEDAE